VSTKTDTGYTGVLIGILACEAMGRPDAQMASIEMLDLEHDGFDGVRVEIADVPPCKTGPRRGRPNWRRATNRQVRLLSSADLDELAAAWGERTGNCVPCTGSGQQFVSWHHIEGTTYRPCTACAGTGRREGTPSDQGGEG
jgi:hypothetical protein